MTDPAPQDADSIGYGAALVELEAILDELDDDGIDIDVLAAKVRRASELIRICRSRVDAARMEVAEVVASFDGEDQGNDEGEGDGDESTGLDGAGADGARAGGSGTDA